MSLPTITVPTYNITVPSTKQKVKYRPYLVKEEKILLMALESEDEVQIADALEATVANCIQTANFDATKLSNFDIEYLFMNIRAKSVGEIIDLTVICPDDNETEVNFQINIEKVKVVFQKDHDKTIELRDDLWIEMKYPSIHDYAKSNSEGDNTFEIIASGIEKIYDSEKIWDSATTTKDEFITWIGNLPKQDYVKIRKFFETMPLLTHTVKLKNPKTGHAFSYTMTGMTDFFG